MSAQRPLPWPTWRALAITAWLALRVAPADALSAVWVLILGKRVRAWNRMCILAAKHDQHYSLWSNHFAAQTTSRFIDGAVSGTALATINLGEPHPENLAAQLARLEREGRTWVVFRSSDIRLDDDVARVIATAARQYPASAIFYWDEEIAEPNGHPTPWIKPGWSERLHMARNCLTGACAIRIADARAALGELEEATTDEPTIWRLEHALCAQGHVPHHLPLLLTRRSLDESAPERWRVAAQALWPGWRFARHSTDKYFLRATPPDPVRWPSVSVIIPTRDRADLMRTCLSGLARTAYPGELEILIVDNGSRDPEALALFAKAQAAGSARILRDDEPFNFSRLNNRAAQVANGDFLCLLNNDVEAVDGDWLCAMVRHALVPEVGAVGAQLLYPDGSIQHAGVAIGLGNAAGHIQRGVAPDSVDHAAWHAVTREVSAVTAACLLVGREHYCAVGGLDEDGFAVAFNDVDFCLKLGVRGLTNVYCAEARLIHAESRSRPNDYRPDQLARFKGELELLQTRWHTPQVCDPRFSSLFSRASEKCVLTLVS